MNIQQIIKTQGWEEVKQIFKQVMDNQAVDTSKSTEEIGQEYLALEKAKKMVFEAITRVERTEEKEYKEQNYE